MARVTLPAAHPVSADQGDRFDAAIRAQQQLEAIFAAIIECARQERGEGPAWAGFDRELLPDIIRALAVRGRELATATGAALFDPDCDDDYERIVSHGG